MSPQGSLSLPVCNLGRLKPRGPFGKRDVVELLYLPSFPWLQTGAVEPARGPACPDLVVLRHRVV